MAWHDAVDRLPTSQLPTSLPTLDEVARRGAPPAALVARYLDDIAQQPWNVLTGHAEVEGSDHAPSLDGLHDALAASGTRVVALDTLADEPSTDLPVCAVTGGTLPGRAGHVSLQS